MKQKITLLELAKQTVGTNMRIVNGKKALEKITILLTLKGLSVPEMSKTSGVSYDKCRRFQGLLKKYDVEGMGDE